MRYASGSYEERKVKKMYSYLVRAEAILAGLFLMLMVILIFIGGVARMLHTPLNWTIDLAMAFFAWGSFLCADIAWRRGLFMSLDLLIENGPHLLRRILVYVNYTIITLFLFFMVNGGLWLAWVSRGRSFNGIPDVSFSWVTMSLPVGALLMLITTVLKLRNALYEDGLITTSDGQAGATPNAGKGDKTPC